MLQSTENLYICHIVVNSCYAKAGQRCLIPVAELEKKVGWATKISR